MSNIFTLYYCPHGNSHLRIYGEEGRSFSALQNHAAGIVYQTRLDNGEYDDEKDERNPEAFKSQCRTEFINWLGDSRNESRYTKMQYLCQWLNEEAPDYAFFFTEVVE